MARNSKDEGYIIWDDFKNGLNVDLPNSKWLKGEFGSVCFNDGLIYKLDDGGIRVVPRGENHQTGEPAFSFSIEQDKNGIPGSLDHIKWITYMNHKTSSGKPGFDVLPNKTLKFEAVMGGRAFGVERHPFGKAVIDCNGDLRLGAPVMICSDPESMMVFDIFITNNMIYAFYERLPFGRAKLGDYAAFSYQIPIAARKMEDIHRLGIAYNKQVNKVSWFIDGEEVFNVSDVGKRINRKYMTIDLGGKEETIYINQLNAGLGLFTLLDGAQPTGQVLVKLTNLTKAFDPLLGEPKAPCFIDSMSSPSSRLFGQGAELICKEYAIIYSINLGFHSKEDFYYGNRRCKQERHR